MMLIAKENFQISTNVPEEEFKKHGIQGRIDRFNSIFDQVLKLMPLDWDVGIDTEHISRRGFTTKLGGKELKMIRLTWTGTGKEEDIRKWADLWNTVEGPFSPCYFIRLNTNSYQMLLHDYASQDSQIVRAKKTARKPKE